MRTWVLTLFCIVALAAVANAKECAKNGECVPANSCNKKEKLGPCDGKKVCCKKSARTKAAGNKGSTSKRKCTQKLKCLDAGGTCVKQSQCKGKVSKKYCKGACVCCITGCAQKKKCLKNGGTCGAKKGQCKGDFETGKNYCKDSCGCCFKDKKCGQKKSCKNLGGTCMKPDEDCEGKMRINSDKGKSLCQQGCGCCVPDKSSPVDPGSCAAFKWGYFGTDGPAYWANCYPVCAGSSQSPVNIITADVKGHKPFDEFEFHNYGYICKDIVLFNNGHTVQATANQPVPSTITGGGLHDEYQLLQFHFHWGKNDERGSEHTINGKMYPAELHLVHFNKKYGTAAEALKHSDGLAVLGIFLEIGAENAHLKPIIDGLSKIKNPNAETLIDAFPMMDLLPHDRSHFYRYSGSLTTPTCNEIVTWTVFSDPISISSAQMAVFRTLIDSHGHAMYDNFRPVQPLNDRFVFDGELHVIDWGYEAKNGPDVWPDYYKICGGSRQSPIDIITDDVKGDDPFKEFTFTNYEDTPSKITLTNNGHTAQAGIEMASKPKIKDGGLDGEYVFLQFHFHWGANDNRGSEHTIDGEKYPMELHLVHYKKEYGNVLEALQHPDGLAVLGIFYEIGAENSNLKHIIDGLPKIVNADSSTELKAFPLGDLLPDNTEDFYRYLGSLTTPTCNEVVVWTVFKETVTISSEQMSVFRTLYDGHKKKMVDNFRPPQPLHDRFVFNGVRDAFKWSYGVDDGPSVWPDYYKVCGGSSQSPIDIVTDDVEKDEDWDHFVYDNYDVVPSTMILFNNGHTAQLKLTSDYTPTITGGGLLDEYSFLQLHFHWGSSDADGSEHTVDGESFPSELHLVHWNTKYGSVLEALKHKDGLAVLGIFLEVSDDSQIPHIADGLPDIINDGDEKSITPFALKDLLPKGYKSEFWRYSGSLTTPTCNEVVIWTVFKNPIPVTSKQLTYFRDLLDYEGLKMVDNFRPPQPVNGRLVQDGKVEFHWCYEGYCGPDNWAHYYKPCGGTSQSPINILTAHTEEGKTMPFTFTGYDAMPKSMTLVNNGHTAQATAEVTATIKDGGLHDTYKFLQFHLHWGSDDSKGSEHTVDGKMYPAELHIVHYNTKYSSVVDALGHPDGLAVLGIFIEIGSTNDKLTPIIDGLANIIDADDSTSLTPFKLMDLLPPMTEKFYRYSGSLTTPTCNEIVTWTVFKTPIKASIAQMKAFRKIEDDYGEFIVDNFRPVQPIHGRPVIDGAKDDYHWGYSGPYGPQYWPDHFPLCGGSHQSPIDIIPTSAVADLTWSPFTFTNYDTVPSLMTILNNGHTAQVSIEMGSLPKISGGGLPGEYTFLQFHFHWGRDDTVGSEHTVSGASYPAELHLVHYKSSYGSVGEAIKHSDGLAVLGIFLQISAEDNAAMNGIIDGLDHIPDPDSEYCLTPTALATFLPAGYHSVKGLWKPQPPSSGGFYRYKGSLTTPTCNEVVIWTVFKDPISISSSQLAHFRKLYDDKGHYILNNYRPTLPVGDRTVYKSMN